MPPESKEGRAEHAEWVMSGGDDGALRESGHIYQARPRSGGLRAWLAVIIVVLLGIIAACSVAALIVLRRPWVGPFNGHEEVVQGLSAGRRMAVREMLKNSGRSPALDSRIAIRLLIGDPPPAPSPALAECAQADLAMAQTVLFPDSIYTKTAATEQPVDDQTVAAVLRKDKTVYLAGCVQYEDSIMRWMHLGARQTHFCRMFVPSSAGIYGVLGTFEDCPAGNSAD